MQSILIDHAVNWSKEGNHKIERHANFNEFLQLISRELTDRTSDIVFEYLKFTNNWRQWF